MILSMITPLTSRNLSRASPYRFLFHRMSTEEEETRTAPRRVHVQFRHLLGPATSERDRTTCKSPGTCFARIPLLILISAHLFSRWVVRNFSPEFATYYNCWSPCCAPNSPLRVPPILPVCVVILLSHTHKPGLPMIYLIWESELQEHPTACSRSRFA